MNNQPQPAHLPATGNDLTRLLALSDGLFGTVLTILVLDLKLPDVLQSASAEGLRGVLDEFAIHFSSYVLTFLVAGVYWMSHHSDFESIERYNRRLLCIT